MRIDAGKEGLQTALQAMGVKFRLTDAALSGEVKPRQGAEIYANGEWRAFDAESEGSLKVRIHAEFLVGEQNEGFTRQQWSNALRSVLTAIRRESRQEQFLASLISQIKEVSEEAAPDSFVDKWKLFSHVGSLVDRSPMTGGPGAIVQLAFPDSQEDELHVYGVRFTVPESDLLSRPYWQSRDHEDWEDDPYDAYCSQCGRKALVNDASCCRICADHSTVAVARFSVPSESGEGGYVVKVDLAGRYLCECPQATENGKWCKHSESVFASYGLSPSNRYEHHLRNPWVSPSVQYLGGRSKLRVSCKGAMRRIRSL